jgi:hypothetical protein
MGFKKIQIFAQNPMVSTYGFTEDDQLAAKPDQNSVFLGRDPHIPDC